MVGDEAIVVESMTMMMMMTKKSPLRIEKQDQFDPKILIFSGNGALVHQKLCDSRNKDFHYIKSRAKKFVERGYGAKTALYRMSQCAGSMPIAHAFTITMALSGTLNPRTCHAPLQTRESSGGAGGRILRVSLITPRM
jgi:hypothetical protein